MTIEMKNFRADWKVEKVITVPREWNHVALGDVVKKIVGGGTPSRERKDFYHGSIPWVTVKDMNGSLYKSSAQEFITEEAIRNSSANLIEENNVIVATRIALGRAFINKAQLAINQDLKAIYLKDSIYPLFFLYWYLSKESLIQSMGSGSTVKGIRLEQLKKLNLLLPPMGEQKKIAEIINAVDEQIEKIQQLIEKTKELKKGLLQQLLTKGIGHKKFRQSDLGEIPDEWDIKKVEDVADLFTDGDWIESKDMSENGIRLIQTGNIGIGYFKDNNRKKFISSNTFTQKKCTETIEGDILICRLADPIGRACLSPKMDEKKIVSVDIAILRVNKERVSNEFINFYLNSDQNLKNVQAYTSGSTRQRISKGNLSKVSLPIPPIKEQRKIAEILTSVNEQIEAYEKEKEKQIELKKGLMQKLLTGEIRVTV